VCLHHSSPGINIDNESGQIIAFSMYQAIGIVGRIGSDANTASHVVGHFQFVFPEIVVNLFLFERKYTYSNTSDLEMPFGNKFFF